MRSEVKFVSGNRIAVNGVVLLNKFSLILEYAVFLKLLGYQIRNTLVMVRINVHLYLPSAKSGDRDADWPLGKFYCNAF